MLNIVKVGNQILNEETKDIKSFDKKLVDVIEQMKQTLVNTHDPEGVGLAAPQVGIPLKLFIIKPTQKSIISVFINPKIINEKIEEVKPVKKSKGKLLEGCLSIPNIWGNVTRKKEITLEYQDIKGEKYIKVFKGFPAVIIQHEMDHLKGILFTKRVIEQKQKLYKSFKNEKGEDEFEQIKL